MPAVAKMPALLTCPEFAEAMRVEDPTAQRPSPGGRYNPSRCRHAAS
ncbi:MAG TPA: hypothetical protein VFO26_06260 [Gaiella sp.]|nr:hypothetical protein [Gaiella sp.]HET9287145.1 hypothetical protein [Gaiella sp.]